MRTVTSKDGTVIAFDQSGTGPAIILVGGALTDRSQPILAQLAVCLSPKFTVFNYDRRGRGGSGDTPPYAVEREVEDLDALITEVGASAFVCGFSSDAALALEAAASSLAIKKLALYEPPFRVAGSSRPLPEDFAKHLNQLISSGCRGDAIEYFMTLAAALPPESAAQMRNGPAWPTMESVAYTLIYDTAILGNDCSLPTERLATITTPTLVIDGGVSPAWMRDAGRAVAEVVPHAQRRTLEGQTHEVSPQILAPVLTEFFKD
jgi:pimeloyl-ACP methyl ester carboxylesterase